MKLALVLGFAAALAANANPVYVAGACVGVCGTDTGNGDIPNAPSGNAYSFVTTAGGVSQGGVIPVGSPGSETNGSTLTTGLFAAMAGDTLNFNFDYITSDGAGYPDYAWAALLNADGSEAALLFTARTEPSPTPIVPGAGLPASNATVNGANPVDIQAGTKWNELGGSSNTCYDDGCGHSGWVSSTYSIQADGDYYLAFGVTNLYDTAFDSGLAVDNITNNGVEIPVGTPEPASIALFVSGLAALGFRARRKHNKNA